ncbi:MAG: HAMP domain-containing histidine kinase [Crocinitomicaceae bacterium]|nr:MAG: HAMP domain-containing histidine kinase [Crocinitomicaceae bacterium]
MRKIRVNFIFALVVVALIAVLVIQAFQTLQLYDRKHAEFEMNLSTSMERIAIRHEKAEDIRRYMHIVNRDFSGQYKDVLKEEFKHLVSAQESISIQDTTLYENGEIQNYLIIKGKSFDSLTGLTTEQKVLARDVRQLRDLFDKQKKQIPHNDSIKLAIQLDQRVLQQIFKKAKFVNDMMVEAFRNNVYEDPSKRVDAAFLDSVIRTEIANDNLPKTYRFMVANEYGIPIQFDNAPSNYDTKLDTLLTGKSVLFPSNILDEDLYLHIYFPEKGIFLFQEMWGPFSISLTLMILIIVALMFMFRTILTQEKLSEIKNDFISNMTHEFKTPISTISLACEALSDKDMMQQNTTDIAPFVKMINDENKRLSLLVERILQSAVMEKGEVKLREEKVILNEIIHEVTNHAQFRIQNSGGTIKLNIPNELITIQTDKMHMTNIVTNLVDNAIKYSSEAPDIEISLRRENKKLLLSVKDHGIGIKKEHLNKVFDKLYRVPTGNVHNVKGFGLGLSYVKAIAELHGWNVVVRSKYGEGSEFTLVMKEL